MNLVQRLWNSISRKRTIEVEQEIATHFALLEDQIRAEGLSPREATLEARKRFGSQAKYIGNTRDVGSAPWFSDLVQDTTFAFRQMRKSLGFTLITVGVIALGISSVTTVFSLVYAVLLHAFPYEEPERLVYLWTPNSQFGPGTPQEVAPSFPDFYDWQRLNRSFSSMTVISQRMVNLALNERVQRIEIAFVDAGFFKTLGSKPELGRIVDPADDQPGNEHVAVISDALWRNQFGGRRDALGRTVTFDREKYTVIGVMPSGFGYPFEGDVPYGPRGFERTQLWVPLALSASQKTDRTNFSASDAAIARLRPGVSVKDAQSNLAAIETRLNLLYPATGFSRGWQVLIKPLVETILGPVSSMLWLLMGSVAFVLLIGCGNVANLLLARISTRREEIALRAGLGAGRARLARQMITESLVLALLGGMAGVLLSFGAVRVLTLLNPGNIPRFSQIAVNLPVLELAAAVTLLSAILFAFAPVLATVRPDLNELLRSGTSRTASSSHRARHVLIAAEVALSFVLLAGAMLLIRSYIKLDGQETGFTSSALTLQLSLDGKYRTAEQKVVSFTHYLDRLQHLPGVIAAGLCDYVPLQQAVAIGSLEIKGLGRPRSLIDARLITPGYFQALGAKLLAGRFFDEREGSADPGPVIVNEAFVKAFFRGRSPVGQQVRLNSRMRWSNIVGVVANIKNMTLEEQPRPEFFLTYGVPYDSSSMGYAIRSKVPAETLIPAMRRILHNLDPALALSDIRTLQQRMADVNAKRRFQMILLTTFAVVAVILALIGIYGVLAYSVAQRIPEIGIRMALGASRTNILRMVVRQGLKVVLFGLALGTGSALLLTRLIQSSLYGVTSNDPITFTLIPLLVVSVASCACLVPALKASRVDPAAAIRSP